MFSSSMQVMKPLPHGSVQGGGAGFSAVQESLSKPHAKEGISSQRLRNCLHPENTRKIVPIFPGVFMPWWFDLSFRGMIPVHDDVFMTK